MKNKVVSLQTEQPTNVIQKIIAGSFSPAKDYFVFLTQALTTVANTGSAKYVNTILKVMDKYPEPVPEIIYENFKLFCNALTIKLNDAPARLILTLKPIIRFSMANGQYYDALRFISVYEKNQKTPDQDIERYKRASAIEIQEQERIPKPDLHHYTRQDNENIARVDAASQELDGFIERLRKKIVLSSADFMP